MTETTTGVETMLCDFCGARMRVKPPDALCVNIRVGIACFLVCHKCGDELLQELSAMRAKIRAQG